VCACARVCVQKRSAHYACGHASTSVKMSITAEGRRWEAERKTFCRYPGRESKYFMTVKEQTSWTADRRQQSLLSLLSFSPTHSAANEWREKIHTPLPPPCIHAAVSLDDPSPSNSSTVLQPVSCLPLLRQYFSQLVSYHAHCTPPHVPRSMCRRPFLDHWRAGKDCVGLIKLRIECLHEYLLSTLLPAFSLYALTSHSFLPFFLRDFSFAHCDFFLLFW